METTRIEIALVDDGGSVDVKVHGYIYRIHNSYGTRYNNLTVCHVLRFQPFGQNQREFLTREEAAEFSEFLKELYSRFGESEIAIYGDRFQTAIFNLTEGYDDMYRGLLDAV